MSLHGSSTLIIALCSAGISGPGMAQVDHSVHATPVLGAARGATDLALADGVVKKIDKPGRRLTISHDKLPSGMPAMTMAFSVKDAAMLDKVRVGQKIRFATDHANSMLVVYLELVQ